MCLSICVVLPVVFAGSCRSAAHTQAHTQAHTRTHQNTPTSTRTHIQVLRSGNVCSSVCFRVCLRKHLRVRDRVRLCPLGLFWPCIRSLFATRPCAFVSALVRACICPCSHHQCVSFFFECGQSQHTRHTLPMTWARPLGQWSEE